MTSDHRPHRLAVALAALAALTGGCTVTTHDSPGEDQRDAAHEMLGQGVEVHLGDRPSRADLHLPEGQRAVVWEQEDRAEFDATVHFSDGHVLRTPADVLGVRSETRTGPPNQLTLQRTDLTLGRLEEILDRAVNELGADRQRVDQYLELADRLTEGTGDLKRAIPTAVSGEEELVLSPIVTADEGRVFINYLITWETDQ